MSQRMFGAALFSVSFFLHGAAADDWTKFSSEKVSSPFILYVTNRLLCDQCSPEAYVATDKIAKEISSAPKFWISSANNPEFAFLSPANSKAGVAFIGADGEIRSFVDATQVDKLSATSRSHFESAPLASLAPAQRVRFSELHYSGFDPATGGTRKLNKTFTPSLTYSLAAAMQGDVKEERMAKITLDNALKLVDQVWGGVFDGAINGNWKSINYQKSAAVQGDALLAFALGYRHFRDEHYLNAARGVVDFVRAFLLQSDGSIAIGLNAPTTNPAEYFALSDSERRKNGLPAVVLGRSVVAAGKILAGLAELYPFMPDAELLELIQRIANSLKATNLAAQINLLDITSGIRGLLGAYEVLGDRAALLSAIQYGERASDFLSPTGSASLVTYEAGKPRVVLGANSLNSIQLAEAMIRLSYLSGRVEFMSMAKQSFGGAVATIDSDPDVAANALKVDSELGALPAHLTVVGPRAAEETKALFHEALRVPSAFRRVELWDKSEGGLVNPDVKYPELSKPAAFICTEKRCSLPIFDAEKIPELWNRLKKK